MKAIAIAAAAALTLSACETATPYQPLSPKDASAGGYSDQQIESNRWKVEFSGNSLTSRDVVERYLIYRAAQLTKQEGYDWFEAVDRHTQKKTSTYVDSDPGFGDPYFAGWPGSYWGLDRGPLGWSYGYWDDPGFIGPSFDIQKVNRYTASTEITMGHGAKPADPHAYAAQDVITHLQGSIQYPARKT